MQNEKTSYNSQRPPKKLLEHARTGNTNVNL